MKAKRSRGFHPYLVSRVQAESAVAALQSANPTSVTFLKNNRNEGWFVCDPSFDSLRTIRLRCRGAECLKPSRRATEASASTPPFLVTKPIASLQLVHDLLANLTACQCLMLRLAQLDDEGSSAITGSAREGDLHG